MVSVCADFEIAGQFVDAQVAFLFFWAVATDAVLIEKCVEGVGTLGGLSGCTENE